MGNFVYNIRTWTPSVIVALESASTGTTITSANSAASKQFDRFIARLTCADNDVRQKAVARTLARMKPPARERAINRLVDMLKSQSKRVRRSAADSLFKMAGVALPALREALLSTQESKFQVRLAELLGRIGAAYSPAHRSDIEDTLETALLEVRNGKVEDAILSALHQIGPDPVMLEMAMNLLRAGKGVMKTS